MAVDLKTLARHGVSSREYKRIFNQDPTKYPKPIQRLRDLISARIKDGRTMNLTPEEWRAHHAVDIAYDVPFNQTTATFVGHLLSQNLKEDEMRAKLEAFGLSERTLFMDVPLPNGGTKQVLNAPVFFQVAVPVVKAYLTVREATLFNSRNRQPFLPYKPLKMTEEDQVLGEIWTDIVGTISRWYGYPSVLRQMIHQMLKYGTAISFTREEWHVEENCVDEEIPGAPDPVTGKPGKPTYNPRRYTEKEGLRYHIPHPTRMFWDLRHPLTSLNTDTGVEYLGHWWLESYGSILENQLYWNRNRIFCGTNWFEFPGSANFWQEIMPCNMKFPIARGWNSPPTREDKASWYTQSGGRDMNVFLTNYFQKLTPKEFGLGRYDEEGSLVDSYDYPVWHRFVVAGDDTIVWAAPCAYCPAWTMNYDYDDNAARSPSMGLELIPWQDQLGNILSQMLLTAKQNLRDVIFYDTNIIDSGDIKQVRNEGEDRYRKTIWIGFDSLQRRVAQVSQQQAFQQVPFTQKSITELLQMVPLWLNLLERVMQISAAESGSQGTHQQSKFELEQIGGGTSNRVDFVGAAIDEGSDAWKKQLYDGGRAYLDPEFEAQVSSDIENLEEIVGKLGFKISGKGTNKVIVTGKVSKIILEGFAAATEGSITPDKEVAQTIFQTVGTVAGQPELFKKVGAATLLAIIEFAAKLAGAPADFRLRVLPKDKQEGDEEVPENILQAIQQAQQATMQAIEEKVAKPAAQEFAQAEQQIKSLEQVVQQFQGIFKIAQQVANRDAIKAKETQAKIQARQQEVAANTQIRQQEAQAKIQMDAEASRAEQARKDAETQAEIDRQHALAAAEAGRLHAESAAGVERKQAESEANVEIAKQTAKAKAQATAKAGTPKPKA